MFRADTIDEAAEEILINCLLMEDTSTTRSLSSRDNVFYFDGWDGLGASAVLRAIARRLTASSPDDQVIHIEYCSMWESRRSLQRAVAEPLRLPDQVMELFDRQDEEDDYQGVPQGSRAGLEQVTTEIYQHVQQQMKHRFFVIIHNGSNEEVDLASLCGFALSGYSTNKGMVEFHKLSSGNNDTDRARMEEDVRRCFQRLWVLVMHNTKCDQILSAQTLDLMTQLRELIVMGAQDWDLGQLHGRLPNIRKLRITNSVVRCSTCSENELFSKMNKMEILDFSGNSANSPMKTLFGPGAISNSSCLETVIVDGSIGGLEHISFSGCSKLKNLFLGRCGISAP
ncbi:hypothetical protein PVAP13_2NG060346 [Panicum virgatum]|uniref:Uncharacterized protein n=1 Tax=Panicum virgatum TaxID=38727 RepID=A0A8T0VEY4_PANVG|nr:hypothetical protein PVAP13_2NG060346 [Panicum virgatum]